MIHLKLFEADYYEKRDGKKIHCLLCPRSCIIQLGNLGNCNARKNNDGVLYALGYNRFTSVHDDPIEKKPIYHYKPGTYTMSFGSAGCNLSCLHCQNFTISQISAENNNLIEVSSQHAIDLSRKHNCETIAYTYNEPLINFEWIRDTGKLAHENGLGNILVSNGLINEKPLEELFGIIDAANIDIKAFTEEFYKNVTAFPGLNRIKKNAIKMWENDIHIELTMLLIPEHNDNPSEIRQFAEWVKESMSDRVPVHFSRFYPHYKMQHVPATPVETILNAKKIAEAAGLKYVYTGNLPFSEINTTKCTACDAVLVDRTGYHIKKKDLNKEGKCGKCGNISDIAM